MENKLYNDFVEINDLIKRGLPAKLQFEADGDMFTRHFLPSERVILCGAGHIAQPLCHYAASLGFSVTVIDERPSFANAERFPEADKIVCDDFVSALKSLDVAESDYVVVITRGHSFDGECLRTILPDSLPMPHYVGMIASKRRAIGLLATLEEEGFSRERLDQIHTPIGLDINALTPNEIAISIVAELIAVRRQNVKRHDRSAILTEQDINPALLDFIVNDPEPKCVMIVFDSSGSTPVKSGTMMALTKSYRSSGSIGGGCGEGAVMRDALDVIGTGSSVCVDVDLSNDIAAEEGMVCGGQMRVFIADVTH